MAMPNWVGVPVARMSIGFDTVEPGSNWLFSSSASGPVKRGTSMPPLVNASVSITPGPPAWVTMAKFLPLKWGRVKMHPAVVSSSREKHLTMPAFLNSASTAASLDAIAPVWLVAASLPRSLEPALMAAIRQPLRISEVAWSSSLSGSAMFSM